MSFIPTGIEQGWKSLWQVIRPGLAPECLLRCYPCAEAHSDKAIPDSAEHVFILLRFPILIIFCNVIISYYHHSAQGVLLAEYMILL